MAHGFVTKRRNKGTDGVIHIGFMLEAKRRNSYFCHVGQMNLSWEGRKDGRKQEKRTARPFSIANCRRKGKTRRLGNQITKPCSLGTRSRSFVPVLFLFISFRGLFLGGMWVCTLHSAYTTNNEQRQSKASEVITLDARGREDKRERERVREKQMFLSEPLEKKVLRALFFISLSLSLSFFHSPSHL